MVANPLNVRACRHRVAMVALVVVVTLLAARIALAQGSAGEAASATAAESYVTEGWADGPALSLHD